MSRIMAEKSYTPGCLVIRAKGAALMRQICIGVWGALGGTEDSGAFKALEATLGLRSLGGDLLSSGGSPRVMEFPLGCR